MKNCIVKKCVFRVIRGPLQLQSTLTTLISLTEIGTHTERLQLLTYAASYLGSSTNEKGQYKCQERFSTSKGKARCHSRADVCTLPRVLYMNADEHSMSQELFDFELSPEITIILQFELFCPWSHTEIPRTVIWLVLNCRSICCVVTNCTSHITCIACLVYLYCMSHCTYCMSLVCNC